MPEVLTEGGGPNKLLTLVREAMRRRHMSGRTEESFVIGFKYYIYFHGKRHPATMGEPEVEAFLMHLAPEGKVAASTRNQALEGVNPDEVRSKRLQNAFDDVAPYPSKVHAATPHPGVTDRFPKDIPKVGRWSFQRASDTHSSPLLCGYGL
jgi:hypothetical protein